MYCFCRKAINFLTIDVDLLKISETYYYIKIRNAKNFLNTPKLILIKHIDLIIFRVYTNKLNEILNS